MSKSRFKKKAPINWPLSCAVILLILVLVTTHMTSRLLARYISSETAFDIANVSAFVFSRSDLIDGDRVSFIDLTGIKTPGDEVVYSFHVRNNSASNVSEIDFSFKMFLELTGNIPLDCTLQSETGEKVTGSTYISPDGSVSLVLEDPAFLFKAGTPEEMEFTLYVSWPDIKPFNNPIYANGSSFAECVLSIRAEQIN